MSRSTKLTEEEKQNGKRKFLTPLPQTLAKTEMHPVSLEMFTKIVKKAIPPSPRPEIEEKQNIGSPAVLRL
jgi:hypothetical protein